MNEKDGFHRRDDYIEQTDPGMDSDDGHEVDIYEEEVEDKFHCRLWYQHSRIEVSVPATPLNYKNSSDS